MFPDMDAQYRVEILVAHLVQHGGTGDPGIVDPDREPVAPRRDFSRKPGHLSTVGNVEREAASPSPADVIDAATVAAAASLMSHTATAAPADASAPATAAPIP